jgi:HEAT repeat-containing protein 5
MLNAVATAMETQDPYILGAMEGMDDVAAASTRRNAGSEPTAMFFVIFGLVYEALSSSTPYSESSMTASGSMPLIALRTMKCLVRREYSGKALLEPTIFDELLNLWYRIAMTEPPVLQTQLMEVIRVFAIEQGRESNPFVAPFSPDACPYVDSCSSSDGTTSPGMVCLRICAYVLKNAIPSAERLASRTISSTYLRSKGS